MLIHAHSGLRWVVLFLLISAIVVAYNNSKKGTPYSKDANKIGLFALIFTHVQLLLGLILYFTSDLVKFGAGVMKDSLLRFYTVEHVLMMLISVILITVGYSKAKKSGSWKKQFTFYLIGLLIILLAIPWPFRNLGGHWF